VSTTRAVEAVTLALRDMLQPVAPNVTARALDRAREQVAGRQLNLCLYEVRHNGNLRNFEPPATRGSAGLRPPLALDLRYLVTAFSDDLEDAVAHGLLTEAMLIMHDSAIMAKDRLRGVLEPAGVHLQCENIRLTPVQLPTEEVSKLWTAFQTHFRLSVAYEASVVLVDTRAAGRAALPVLQRGRGAVDDAPAVTSGRAPQLDSLHTRAWGAGSSAPARTGDRIVLAGTALAVGGVRARAIFRHPRLAAPVSQLVDAESTSSEAVVAVPATLPAGFATVELATDAGAGPALVSNSLPLAIATRVGAITKTAGATVGLKVACDRLAADQQATLLIGSAQVPARQTVLAGGPLEFDLPALPAATYVVRVRIDGVDSIPLADPDDDPDVVLSATFDPAQKVTLP
jgi:hypothetical protein